MVARQDSQPARVDRQAFVDSELEGKIGKSVRCLRAVHPGVPSRVLEVPAKLQVDPVHMGQESLVGHQPDEPLLIDST